MQNQPFLVLSLAYCSMPILDLLLNSVLVCLAIFPSLCRVRDLSYIRIYLVFHNPRRIALENLPRGTRSRGTVLLSSRRCLSIYLLEVINMYLGSSVMDLIPRYDNRARDDLDCVLHPPSP